jgi:hypothetical protein
MPPALDIDREAVRVLVLAVGVREAARRMELPEATVQAWSARGKWLAQPIPTPIPPTVQRPATDATISPANAMQAALRDDSEATRSSLSRAMRRVARHVERQADTDPGAVLSRSQDVKASAQTAALVHGWEAKAGQTTQVMVNVQLLGLSVEPQDGASAVDV